MAGVLSDQYKVASLEGQRDGVLLWTDEDAMYYHLFVGSLVPDHATVLGDITELVGDGYGTENIQDFLVVTLTADFHARMQAAAVSFQNTGVTDWDEVTGWYWTNHDNTILIRSGRYDDAFTLTPGGIHTVIPVWTRTGD